MSQAPDTQYTADRPPYHIPVMLEEVVGLFAPLEEGVIVDATYGGGGHASALLERLDQRVRVLGVDRDPEAVRRAARREQERGREQERERGRLELTVGNFGRLDALLEERGVAAAAGVLFDLGVSSRQLDEARRGFSYRRDGPLDMRMGPDAARSARELVNRAPVPELARIIRTFGEERFALRIARAISEARPLDSTVRLAEVVRAAVPAAARRSGGHPARRTFQAVRIAVNDELGALSSGLEHGIRALRPGGRCVAISYHSLEDRLVKRRFRRGEGRAPGPVLPVPPPVELTVLTPRPLRPRPEETARNPRSRSARLRAAEKAA